MEPQIDYCPVCRREVGVSMLADSQAIDESLHPLLAVNMHDALLKVKAETLIFERALAGN